MGLAVCTTYPRPNAWITDFGKAAHLTATTDQSATIYDMRRTGNGKPVPNGIWPYIEEYGFTHIAGVKTTDLRAYAVDWSPLTTPYKKAIEADEQAPKYPWKRARLNSYLKFDLLARIIREPRPYES